jgi:hypothetical protein
VYPDVSVDVEEDDEEDELDEDVEAPPVDELEEEVVEEDDDDDVLLLVLPDPVTIEHRCVISALIRLSVALIVLMQAFHSLGHPSLVSRYLLGL